MAGLACMLHQAGRISRNRPAILATDVHIGYGEFDLMVSATAAWLQAAGLHTGQRVALYMEDSWAAVTLILALIRIGAIAAPLSTRLPVKAVRRQLDQIHCTTLIARVRATSQPVLEGITCLDPDGLVDRSLSADQTQTAFTIPDPKPASIIFTSGQTHEPKAVLHSYGNHYYSALGVNQQLRFGSTDCWLLALPLYHVGGLSIIFRCLQAGAAMAVPASRTAWVEALSQFPVTHLSLVPTQLQRLLDTDLPKEKRATVRAVVVGGAAAPPALLDRAREAGWPIATSYGNTEMTSQITTARPHTRPTASPTTGPVLRYREIQIQDDGEIWTRGATCCLGYVEGDAVRPVLNESGWLATGDNGEWNHQQHLRVTGRQDHLIISGGENIQPMEIEQALLAIPGIRQAVVVGVAHPEFGQRPVAFVDDTSQREVDALRAGLAATLPRFKIPDHFHPWPTDLKTTGIKPPRRALQERATAGKLKEKG